MSFIWTSQSADEGHVLFQRRPLSLVLVHYLQLYNILNVDTGARYKYKQLQNDNSEHGVTFTSPLFNQSWPVPKKTSRL